VSSSARPSTSRGLNERRSRRRLRVRLCVCGGVRTGAFLLVVVAGTHRAAAQRTDFSIDLQATRLRYADTVHASGASISPELRLDGEQASLRVAGTYAQFANAWSMDGTLDGSVFTPEYGPWSLEVGTSLGGSTHEDGARTGSANALARVHAMWDHAGVWLGGAGGLVTDGISSRHVQRGDIGAWWNTTRGSATLIAEPSRIDGTTRYTDLSAMGHWRRARIDLGGLLGTRTGTSLPFLDNGPSTWASASAVVWLVPKLAIVAGGGTYPVDYAQGFPGGRFASLGIRLSSRSKRLTESSSTDTKSRPGFVDDVRVTKTAGGERQLQLHATNVRSVDVNGDFTGWKPHRLMPSLTPSGDGWWTIQLPRGAGTYQLVVRTNDGTWAPPPTLPTIKDEFGGVTGVLVVP